MSLYNYLKSQGRLFKLCFARNYYKIFKRNNIHYFNVAPIAKFCDTKSSFDKFPVETKNAVNSFWEHIRYIWSNNDV